MIQVRRYTEKEDRNPTKYLGIDGNPIPSKYFKGIYTDSGNIYTYDVEYGIQLVVDSSGKNLIIMGHDIDHKDMYFLKEDLENFDKWLLAARVCTEYKDPSTCQIQLSFDPFRILLERYQRGETGLLEFDEKKYNTRGEYMRFYQSFDTRTNERDLDIRDCLYRHVNFIYSRDKATPWVDRVMTIETNSENIMSLAQLLVAPQLKIMEDNNMIVVAEGKLNYSFIIAPPFGKMELIENNSVQDFKVTKKDKNE